ncbi:MULTISPECIES: YrdB family protein [Microbacterium]|mgnify:FL=1|uniref:YrdB family protein n=1 Tax=Microbacterium TaxID=33882 RepID=UPI001656FBF0|nr:MULTISPECIES: YrdB family protein [Microbacterium]MCT1363652.1 YrdB family protein [Microbacterium sp. p3-SID131]MCT1377568.1 YrdB family protein [Microbacterium sp. p3-SID337]MCZ0710223.1 YrdB family protein [Microbacterium paraoxydans]MDH5134894.1 YrdB family protein [Microbacterium sp. RD10]MDH5137818.1 YrdB family protein [Microbacterium sp. RD11]
MTPDSAPVAGVDRPAITALDIVRVVVLIVAIASLALWGFASWDLPWSIVIGVGAPVVTLLLWALFLSPRPVLRVHPFLRAVVELFIYVGVTIAWWSMGQALIGTAFALVAVVAGVLSGRRALA